MPVLHVLVDVSHSVCRSRDCPTRGLIIDFLETAESYIEAGENIYCNLGGTTGEYILRVAGIQHHYWDIDRMIRACREEEGAREGSPIIRGISDYITTSFILDRDILVIVSDFIDNRSTKKDVERAVELLHPLYETGRLHLLVTDYCYLDRWSNPCLFCELLQRLTGESAECRRPVPPRGNALRLCGVSYARGVWEVTRYDNILDIIMSNVCGSLF